MTNNKTPSAEEMAALFRLKRDEVMRAFDRLQAESAEKDKEIRRMSDNCTKVVNDAEIWKQKYNSVLDDLARVTAERDAAVADLHSMHTLCMDIGGCCPECGSQIDDLLDAACTFCKGAGVSCWENDLGNGNRCAAFEWRGRWKED